MFKQSMAVQRDNIGIFLGSPNTYFLEFLDPIDFEHPFLPKIKDPIDEYLKKFSVLGEEKLLIYDTKAKKIEIGGGFHNWHYENTGLQVSARKLVVQLYLNTIEEGGETEFLYINKRIKAEQGRLIIFPAAFTHTHRGNPPIGQDKYIISTWAVSQDNGWR